MDPVSVVAPIQKRSWLAITASVAVAIALTITAALVTQPGRRLLSRGGTAAEERTPQLEQAAWRFTPRAAGATGKIGKRQRAALRRERTEIRGAVTSIYHGLFVEPEGLPGALKAHFTPLAASSFRRSGAGVSGAGLVQTTYRGATITAQPTQGVRRAVATVTVKAVELGTGRRMVHRATLWFQRPKQAWKVVAFDLSQRPVAQPAGKKKGKKG